MSARSYSDALAEVHHQDFGWAASGASQLLLRELSRRGVHDGLVVDLGSGSGILARRLTQAGFDLMGVDISSSMVRVARREAPGARFVRASAFEFEPPPCVGASAIGEVLNYRFDAGVSMKSLARVFRRVHAALPSKGIFLFDLSGPGRAGPSGLTERIFETSDYSMLIRVQEDRRRRLMTRTHVLFVKDGTRYRRREEAHELKLFEPNAVSKMLRTVGFTVRRLPTYPGGPRLRGWSVFVATKKG